MYKNNFFHSQQKQIEIWKMVPFPSDRKYLIFNLITKGVTISVVLLTNRSNAS